MGTSCQSICQNHKLKKTSTEAEVDNYLNELGQNLDEFLSRWTKNIELKDDNTQCPPTTHKVVTKEMCKNLARG